MTRARKMTMPVWGIDAVGLNAPKAHTCVAPSCWVAGGVASIRSKPLGSVSLKVTFRPSSSPLIVYTNV